MNSIALVGLALLQREGEALGGFLSLVIFLVVWAYFAVCLQKIADKTNTENAWWAWVPILNALLMLKVAQKPLWWIILLLIPLVNFIVAIVVWVAICNALNKSPWILLGFLIPVVNLAVLPYLAFSD